MTTKTITYPSGAIYTGQVIDDDVWHGRGKIQQFEDGKLTEEYEGDFIHDTRHGYGTLINHAHNSIYTGQWVNDVKEGIGKETVEKNGTLSTYEGEWVQDKPHGNGTYTSKGFTYTGKWDTQFIDGIMRYEDIEIFFTWENDKNVIRKVNNPTFRTIDIKLLLDTIINFDNTRILSLDMYYLIGFLNGPTYIKNFLHDINTRHCEVRLVALCHAALLDGFPLSIPNLQRISNVPNGIPNFDTLKNKIDILDLQSIEDNDEYIKEINKTFMKDLKTKCRRNPKLFENGAEYLEMCRTITIPNKIFTRNQPILNKLFDAFDSKVCLLLLYNDRGEYINLFSIQPRFTLQNVLKRIPNCSNCIFVDLSCSSKEDYIVHKQIQYMGGKTKKKI